MGQPKPLAFALSALLAGSLFYLGLHLARPAVLQGTAAAFSALLTAIGQPNERDGLTVSGEHVAFLVVDECTGAMPLAILLGAVAASPLPVLVRVLGGLALGAALLLINQVRLLSLWFVSAHWAEGFAFVHAVVWQPLLVLLVLALWFPWLSRNLHRHAHGRPAGGALLSPPKAAPQ